MKMTLSIGRWRRKGSDALIRTAVVHGLEFTESIIKLRKQGLDRA